MTLNSSAESSTATTRPRLSFIANTPLYLKLAVAFFVIAIFTVTSVVVLANRVTTDNLIVQVGSNLRSQAQAHATTIVNLLADQLVSRLQALAMSNTLEIQVATQNGRYSGTEAEIRREIDTIDRQWAEASDSDQKLRAVLNNASTHQFRQYTLAFPNNIEIFATDRYGALVSSNVRTSDYNQADEDWWQATWNNGQGAIYLSQPLFDDSTQVYSMIVGVPIYSVNDSSQIIGVARSTHRLDAVLDTVFGFALGETGSAALYLNDNTLITRTGQITIDAASAAQIAYLQTTEYHENSFGDITRLISLIKVSDLTDQPYIQNLDWRLVVYQDMEEALQPITAATRATITAGVVVALIAILLALVISRFITSPIRVLTQTARKLGAGDLSQRAELTSRDEFGQMAQTMNNMAEQLQGIVASLEERVASRTRDLETAAEVNAQISTILDTNRLLQDVVDLTKERFRLYHAHIYLADDSGQMLALAAGAGQVGRQMVSQGKQIDLNNVQSIVAEAARTRKGVIINDVTASPTFLPNALLPDTRAELAVPLAARGQLLGVLDVQSDQVGYFDQDVLDVLELMAGQIATAISNARLYEVADRTSRHERALGSIDRKIQGAVDMDDILQATVRELGKALRVPYTAIELQLAGSDQQESE